jgi:hypothetical protein
MPRSGGAENVLGRVEQDMEYRQPGGARPSEDLFKVVRARTVCAAIRCWQV